MIKKCRNPNCGWKIIEYPIYKGQEQGEPFAFKKINWRNLIIGDWTKMLFLIAIMFLAWSYGHDTIVIREIYEDPCIFVEKNQQACTDIKRYNPGFTLNQSTLKIDLNFSDPT